MSRSRARGRATAASGPRRQLAFPAIVISTGKALAYDQAGACTEGPLSPESDATFGKFSVSERSARDGRNPATGEAIHIAASTAAKFSPATALKKALNN